MNLWAVTAFVIAAAAAIVSLSGWSGPAAPFLTVLAFVFVLFGVSAVGSQMIRRE
ncbi:MAG: hypothetical protein KDN19_08545 [Verrucomicrobiae bacterium]|nr:hypothetical protein [Verrucomicrobiae bacterium]